LNKLNPHDRTPTLPLQSTARNDDVGGKAWGKGLAFMPTPDRIF